ncbi:MAG: ATP-dependent DNA helicase RecG [Oscillospiraceae bacterium]|jgi:ATP-dependent DNA helicase RecG|nr:ATP-dependent DNA helicase RecG [Oscillospiraceae bacterium]
MLNNDITTLRGISTKRAALYKKLGITTVRDLIFHFPRGYIDYSLPVKINSVNFGETCVVKAEVIRKLRPFYTGGAYARNSLSIYKAALNDGESEFLCVFFNSEYNWGKLLPGKSYIFHGKAGGNELLREITSPLFIEAGDPNVLVPKYRLTAGLTQVMIANNLKTVLPCFDEKEIFPDEILKEFSLFDKKTALEKIHFPESQEEAGAAKRRLAFEELLVLQLGMNMLRKRNRKLTGTVMQKQDLSGFYRALPFEPTGAQKRAVDEAVNDMQKLIPMNRLLQGDVGSGKTMVAAALCFFAHNNGFQSVFMAPTELLAAQHYNTLKAFLEPLGINVELLTGSLTAAEKKAVKTRVKTGEAHVVTGTQALIQKGVEFMRLGFAVTDEQHRFGVNQRSTLVSMGENPHTLVMSATPIPRTLALIIYGDLDISLLDEMPKGRIPINTYSVNTSYRERLYRFILKKAAEGSQSYIVCPLIEDSEAGGSNERASAVNYYSELKRTYLKDINVGLLHGKMKQAEKDAVMEGFKNGDITALISTTVIEVGIDVPNAVIMLIENAERFGLSQLHQLRGRVGRGEKQSYCILVTDNDSAYTKARLDTMTKTANGFEVANVDLKLRGPGDFFGRKQHGLPELRMADMAEDVSLVSEIKELAGRILERDSGLKNPEHEGLKARINELFSGVNEHGFN